MDRALALNLAALVLLVLSNSFPFLTLKFQGAMVENLFISGVIRLYQMGMGEISLLVLLTSLVFPLVNILGMIYVLLPLKLGFRPWFLAHVFGLADALRSWSLISVFMLGVLVSMVKLLELADIIPGVSLAAFVALMLVMAAAHASLDPEAVWQRMEKKHEKSGREDEPRHPKALPEDSVNPGAEWPTAAQLGLVSCHTCGKLLEDSGHHGQRCTRCGSGMHSRKRASLQQTWALLVSAVVMFIPANLYPAMTMHQLGQKGVSSTILGGVIYLIEQGSSGLALIIFFASIMVPALKLIILSGLLISVQQGWKWRPKDRTFLFRVTEVIGAWSMVDVYVVAVLVGLVNLGLLADVRAEIGMSFFGAVVVMTMLAAMRFDPRLIWDNLERQT
tara:strand:- start:104 stop:1273 length:1170 start_codon:yes stop_codon:yes gene_type:complete